MRELLFKNMTSDDHKKHDVSVQEIVQKNGLLAKSERRCRYFVKYKARVDNPEDIVNLAKIKEENKKSKRCFYVLKCHDSNDGIDKLICKFKGTFYAVIGKVIYCIVFVHSFKIRFKALAAG